MDVLERKLNRELLRYAVSRQMFCERTGELLDVRSAVLVTVTFADKGTVTSVLTGKAWDSVADSVTAFMVGRGTVEAIDGRTL